MPRPPTTPPAGAAPPPVPGARRGPRRALAAATVCLAGFLVLAGRVSATAGQDDWDVAAQQRLLALHRPDLHDLARLGAATGSPWVLSAATVLGAALVWRHARRPALAGALVGVPLATAGVVHLVTLAFAEPRPAFGHVLGRPVLGGSFPSAPAADATTVWGLLAVAGAALAVRRGTRLLALVGWAVLSLPVGWDQLALGRWPSDVVAGGLLGVATVAAGHGLLLAGGPGLLTGGDPGPSSARSSGRGPRLDR